MLFRSSSSVIPFVCLPLETSLILYNLSMLHCRYALLILSLGKIFPDAQTIGDFHWMVLAKEYRQAFNCGA